ncbi:hypothetical protein DPMN_044490 [Dreissena polymorpha]|uniref:Uncharacterized protein n=1 Tax=Dreissena polymorpha TaxID=45954 RepID=A0A9D4D493_DREPO|nr:hypothetical protein DPMN_044490 [Dreissena polymorpha]
MFNFSDGRTDGKTDRHKHSPLPGGHVFEWTGTVFELGQDIRTNIGKNVTLRICTIFHNSNIRKHETLPGGHVFEYTGTVFELGQYSIRTNVLSQPVRRDLTGISIDR